MSFNQTFQIYNCTPYKMTLDSVNSENLDDAWPSTIPAQDASGPGYVEFEQDGFFSVNPTAIYIMQSTPSINATMHFYCAGTGLTVQVTTTLEYSSNPPFTNLIRESNTNPDQEATGSNNLSIKDFGNNSSRGIAIFVIGQDKIPS
ncbi:hypothetical protein AB4090_02655 [Acidithiobacillus sp. IBUN Pt1247-S3]|uniref:hypothetical protein n=1 Tax=Acidithiobacillus sp. IBUN Pt1247-S3 TaxID=3166642 RepID=UPI0034E5F12C